MRLCNSESYEFVKTNSNAFFPDTCHLRWSCWGEWFNGLCSWEKQFKRPGPRNVLGPRLSSPWYAFSIEAHPLWFSHLNSGRCTVVNNSGSGWLLLITPPRFLCSSIQMKTQVTKEVQRWIRLLHFAQGQENVSVLRKSTLKCLEVKDGGGNQYACVHVHAHM